MGYLKMVQREDEKQAAMAGLQSKQLTQPGVEKHLADFGVDAESASHTQLNQLSGGTKVKVAQARGCMHNLARGAAIQYSPAMSPWGWRGGGNTWVSE